MSLWYSFHFGRNSEKFSEVPWNLGISAFMMIGFEKGLLMLPKSAIAIPSSDVVPPPAYWCQKLLSLSPRSPMWISPPLRVLLNALRLDATWLAVSSGGLPRRCLGVLGGPFPENREMSSPFWNWGFGSGWTGFWSWFSSGLCSALIMGVILHRQWRVFNPGHWRGGGKAPHSLMNLLGGTTTEGQPPVVGGLFWRTGNYETPECEAEFDKISPGGFEISREIFLSLAGACPSELNFADIFSRLKSDFSGLEPAFDLS